MPLSPQSFNSLPTRLRDLPASDRLAYALALMEQAARIAVHPLVKADGSCPPLRKHHLVQLEERGYSRSEALMAQAIVNSANLLRRQAEATYANLLDVPGSTV